MYENEEKKEVKIMNMNLGIFEDINRDKIVVDYLAITSQEGPYYTIVWHPINSNETYEGYGSDNPFLVKWWAEKYFYVKKKECNK